MALLHSPRIITDGLALCLDAGNRDSYPGTGDSWRNLITEQNATKSGANTIIFQDRYFRFPNVGDNDPDNSNRFTISRTNLINGAEGTVLAWARMIYTGDKSNRYIFQSVGTNTNRFYLQAAFSNSTNTGSILAVRGNPGVSITISTTIPLNAWFFAGLTWYNSNTLQGILNGNLIGTPQTFVNTSAFSDNVDIGQQAGLGRVFPGDISTVLYYSRTLSQAEILQNYNALKGRYNL